MTPEQHAKWVCFNFEQRTDDYNEKLYDAALKQIAAAVAEEKERCAKVAGRFAAENEARMKRYPSRRDDYQRDAIVAGLIAAAIRGGEA